MLRQARPTAIARGIATRLPLLGRYACGGSGGTGSARYCYSVWLRHLVKAAEQGFPVPDSIAELGPGDSVGIGLAALLSGARRYYGVDAKPHAAAACNVRVFDELVELFADRAGIPDADEWPGIAPRLATYQFPHQILPDDRLRDALRPERLRAIRVLLTTAASFTSDRPSMASTGDAEKAVAANAPVLCYVAPWDGPLPGNTRVDMVLSQAVLEHVERPHAVYGALHGWLRDGGLMSHVVDFRSHDLTRDWYGHWTLSDRAWDVVRGGRPYLINRLPHSYHVVAMREAGFRVLVDDRRRDTAPAREQLAPRFRHLADDDLHISGAFFQCIKADAC